MKHPLTVRVSAGALRGRRLRYPPAGRRDIRPTSSRTKESVFDALGEVVAGACFVDLFAGAGGVGIEALSRGASFVHFVESDADALSFLERNLIECAVEPGRFRVHAASVETYLASGGLDDRAVRVVYADPPYDRPLDSLLAVLDENPYPHVRFVVVEHRGAAPEREWRFWRVLRTRRLGDTGVTYLTPIQGEDS